MTNRIRVAVVFGGMSSEHGISCVTAAGVLSAIDRDRFEVVPVGITRTGEWVFTADDAGKLQIEGDRVPEVLDGDGAAVTVGMGAGASSLVAVDSSRAPASILNARSIDVAFPLL